MSYTVENFHKATILDGVIRWNSNGRCLPKECCDELFEAGLIDSIICDETHHAREKETREFIEEYRAAQANRTAEQREEERLEARAAMGPGVEMVNIFTGEVFIT